MRLLRDNGRQMNDNTLLNKIVDNSDGLNLFIPTIYTGRFPRLETDEEKFPPYRYA